ncbi:hypothetical protein SAMN06297251_111156 [Fulvimarina manganoxydans]|uniref:Uncharacterized protein n=1 Tax=Fulvimarina manganoxydans TaxID=937218 RepID=A0A1W2CVJ5_9HYPH|nr:hypothetical protein [Fulvimarina manganoxydans]SMC89251.1 hypothetical protein SAMN06297251_111156 [Fulvimarina manganoxydans]
MAFKALHKAVVLTAAQATDVTGGGLAETEGGTLMLNLNNDSGAEVTVAFIAVVPAGEELERRFHWQSGFTIPADDGGNYQTILPMILGPGDKVFVEADADIPAQLNGEARA